MKKNPLFLVRPVFAIPLIPFVLIVYSLLSMGLHIDYLGFLDNIAFIMAFYFFFVIFTLPKSKVVKLALLSILTGSNIILYWGNLLYYRFFNGWLSLDSFKQYGDVPSIATGIWTLVKWQDIPFMILIPLVLFILIVNKLENFQWNNSLLIIPVMVLAFLPAHVILSNYNYNISQINPYMDLPRQAFFKFKTKHLMFDIKNNTIKHVMELFPTSDQYEYAGDPTYPLIKKPSKIDFPLPTLVGKKPNVVFILLESVRAFESGIYNKNIESFTPNLDLLAKNGLVFTKFYANSTQTVRGELSSLYSFYPNYLGGPIYINYPDLNLLSLPSVLKYNGYTTLWISSYSSLFHNKKTFWMRNGIEKIFDKLPASYLRSPELGWGPADVDLFRYAVDILAGQKEPFYAEIMTLSNHFEFNWDYPSNKFAPRTNGTKLYRDYTRGIFYTDYALGKFFEEARKRDFFNNTIFVITGDHGIWTFPNIDGLDKAQKEEIYFRMPLVVFAPQYISPQVIDLLGSHVDVTPTILDILGIAIENPFIGRSLMREISEERFVLTMHDRRWNFRKGNIYCYDLGEERFLEHFPTVKNKSAASKEEPHVCFETTKDLFHTSSNKDRRILSDLEQRKLISRAKRLLSLNTFLLLSNRIWPAN